MFTTSTFDCDSDPRGGQRGKKKKKSQVNTIYKHLINMLKFGEKEKKVEENYIFLFVGKY